MKKGEKLPTKTQYRVKLGFFVLISLGVFVLAWIVFRPFVILLATAAIVAVIVTPFHRWLIRIFHHHRKVSAFLVVVCTFILVVLPITIGGFFLTEEISSLLATSAQSGGVFEAKIVSNPIYLRLPAEMQKVIRQIDVDYIVTAASKYIAQNVGDILASTSKYLLLTVLFFFSLYYFLTEREYLYRKFLALSPLSDSIDNSLLRRLILTIRAVVVGSVIVGLIQAILASIGFFVFGLPSAAIWGVATLFAAQVPTIGTAIITVPASIYLFISGNTAGAIGLLIWSVLIVGTIDNFVKPKLVEGKTKMHALPVLLAMLGGLEVFGPVGFILGPAILAAALAFFEMYEAGVLEGNVKL